MHHVQRGRFNCIKWFWQRSTDIGSAMTMAFFSTPQQSFPLQLSSQIHHTARLQLLTWRTAVPVQVMFKSRHKTRQVRRSFTNKGVKGYAPVLGLVMEVKVSHAVRLKMHSLRPSSPAEVVRNNNPARWCSFSHRVGYRVSMIDQLPGAAQRQQTSLQILTLSIASAGQTQWYHRTCTGRASCDVQFPRRMEMMS